MLRLFRSIVAMFFADERTFRYASYSESFGCLGGGLLRLAPFAPFWSKDTSAGLRIGDCGTDAPADADDGRDFWKLSSRPSSISYCSSKYPSATLS